jgi:predicted transcriptional regulator
MEYKKATFNLDPDLHQRLKVISAVQRREMVDLVRDALTAYFGWNRMTETEQRELKAFELTESQGKGRRAELQFQFVAAELGCAIEPGIAAQLLQYLDAEQRLIVDVWDGVAYRPLRSFGDVTCLYRNGGNLHAQLTIPGRIRYEHLQQRQTWERTQPK